MSRFQGFCVSMAAALAMVNFARSQEEEKCTSASAQRTDVGLELDGNPL